MNVLRIARFEVDLGSKWDVYISETNFDLIYSSSSFAKTVILIHAPTRTHKRTESFSYHRGKISRPTVSQMLQIDQDGGAAKEESSDLRQIHKEKLAAGRAQL